jgi:hypothetical protein
MSVSVAAPPQHSGASRCPSAAVAGVYNAALFAVRLFGLRPEYQEENLVKTIAEFRIPYCQVLDPEGKVVADCPSSPRTPRNCCACTA